jgi:hypothetical protein
MTEHIVNLLICYLDCIESNATFAQRMDPGRGTAVAQWLRFCATNRKVAGSIPDGVIEYFSVDIILPITL